MPFPADICVCYTDISKLAVIVTDETEMETIYLSKTLKQIL